MYTRTLLEKINVREVCFILFLLRFSFSDEALITPKYSRFLNVSCVFLMRPNRLPQAISDHGFDPTHLLPGSSLPMAEQADARMAVSVPQVSPVNCPHVFSQSACLLLHCLVSPLLTLVA